MVDVAAGRSTVMTACGSARSPVNLPAQTGGAFRGLFAQ
jgi:hypothetical protein